jgi:polysaccharide export outer membrane protein
MQSAGAIMKTFLLFVLACGCCSAQAVKAQADPLSTGQPYVLEPGDQVVLQAVNAEEVSGKPFRIETDGTIDFPLLGTMHPAGLTVEQFESKLRGQLAQYVRNPQVTVAVTQFRSENVTFTGAFKTPGVFPLQGRHSLTEMLAVVAGLNENSSRILRITRQQSSGPLPLPNVRVRADGLSSVADLDTTFVNGRSAADDFLLKPNDVITAFPVDPIVIGGEITHPGVVPLGDHKSLSLMQVVFMSGGLTKDASSKRIKVFRQLPDSGKREELQVSLAKIQKGMQPDLPLLPRDMVIIPRSDGKVASRQILALTTGLTMSAITTMMMTH